MKIRNTLNQKIVIKLKKDKEDKNIDLLAKETLDVPEGFEESPHLQTLLEREIIEIVGKEDIKKEKEDIKKTVPPAKKKIKSVEELLKLPSNELKRYLKNQLIDDLKELAKTLEIEPVDDFEEIVKNIIESIEARKKAGTEE